MVLPKEGVKVGWQSRHNKRGDSLPSTGHANSELFRFQIPKVQPARTNSTTRRHSAKGNNTCNEPRTPHIKKGKGVGHSRSHVAIHIPKPRATVHVMDQGQLCPRAPVVKVDRRRSEFQARFE